MKTSENRFNLYHAKIQRNLPWCIWFVTVVRESTRRFNTLQNTLHGSNTSRHDANVFFNYERVRWTFTYQNLELVQIGRPTIVCYYCYYFFESYDPSLIGMLNVTVLSGITTGLYRHFYWHKLRTFSDQLKCIVQRLTETVFPWVPWRAFKGSTKLTYVLTYDRKITFKN